MEAAGAATPFLRGAREARDTQKGEPAAYIIYKDFFSDWLTDWLTYLLTTSLFLAGKKPKWKNSNAIRFLDNFLLYISVFKKIKKFLQKLGIYVYKHSCQWRFAQQVFNLSCMQAR